MISHGYPAGITPYGYYVTRASASTNYKPGHGGNIFVEVGPPKQGTLRPFVCQFHSIVHTLCGHDHSCCVFFFCVSAPTFHFSSPFQHVFF